MLILDEPPSALGVRQTANVLYTADRVPKQGIGVVFITHNVRHALAVGDRFTVLNRGQTLGTAERGTADAGALLDLMAGGQELATLEFSLGGLSETCPAGGPTPLKLGDTKQVTPPFAPYTYCA